MNATGEVVVHEVRRIREVGAPAEQEERHRAGDRVVDERRRLLQVERDVDADLGELGLDVGHHLGGLGDIAAGLGAVAERHVEPIGVAGVGEQLLGLLDVTA